MLRPEVWKLIRTLIFFLFKIETAIVAKLKQILLPVDATAGRP
jgi:hypothetical protein